jgi:hypothetical protein
MQYCFSLTSDMPDVEAAASELFSAWTDESGQDPATSYEIRALDDEQGMLLKNGSRVQQGNGAGAMLTWVIADVSANALQRADGVVAVHAGVVASQGVAVLLPAPPDHGKTTTTIGLVRSGFDLLSDECAAIGLEDDLVHPFPRPLIVAPEAMALFPDLRASLPAWADRLRHLDYLVPPQEIRQDCLSGAREVRFVVAPRYEAGASTVLEPMSRADMLMLLIDQTFNLRIVDSRGVARLAEMLRGVECYRLRIGDLAEAVGLIAASVEGGSR